MWCPKCRNEYRPGITVCADCGCQLVESLDESPSVEADKEEVFEEAVPESSVDLTPDPEESTDESADVEPKGNKTRTYVYRDSNEKAEDHKSSAYALFLVGFLGLIFIILLFLGKIPFLTMTGTNRFLICGVMGAMFLAFIIMGFVSMKSYKKCKSEAVFEHSMEEDIKKWCAEHLCAADIDAACLGGVPKESEEAYFTRAAIIREKIKEKFVGLDDAFLDHFVDEYYSSLYGEDKTGVEA